MLRPSLVGVMVAGVVLGGIVVRAQRDDVPYLPLGQGTTTIEGRIETIAFTDPRIVFDVRTADGTLYRMVWGGIQSIARYGVSSETLKVGDYVVVTGSRAVDPTVPSLSRLTEIRRPSD